MSESVIVNPVASIKILIPSIFLIMAVSVGVFLLLNGTQFFSPKDEGQTSSVNKKAVVFRGTIIETNNGCWADGICSLKVDEKWVVVEKGGLLPPGSDEEPGGQMIGISFDRDTQQYVGKKVEVYAKEIRENTFTIYGSRDYYVKILE